VRFDKVIAKIIRVHFLPHSVGLYESRQCVPCERLFYYFLPLVDIIVIIIIIIIIIVNTIIIANKDYYY